MNIPSRYAKIVATLGPASSTKEMIKELVLAGANVFRLNFSHGTHEDHEKNYHFIRELDREFEKPLGILMDLQGPKIRIGRFKEGPIHLKEGQKFRLDLLEEEGDSSRVSLPHPEVFQALAPGARLLLDDGKIRLTVQSCQPESVDTLVNVGGPLSERKGVNIPDVPLPLSPLTPKDRRDLEFGLRLGVDWVALSFVQTANDIREARQLIGEKARIIAKIEKPQALSCLEEIMELADGIMVARGDLGVEMLPEEVPGIQKRILKLGRQKGRPVVVATQMLESMIQTPTPTRAEASDVATAIFEGADAVMLSAESASGKYPVEAVTMMSRIITQVEQDPLYPAWGERDHPHPLSTLESALSSSAREISQTLPVSGIVTFTRTGVTALGMARERPKAPILAISPHLSSIRQLTLVWGVSPLLNLEWEDFDSMTTKVSKMLEEKGIFLKETFLVILGGVPFQVAGSTNTLRIVQASPSPLKI